MLTLTSVTTVLGPSSTCSISVDSLPSVNVLCYLQMVESCKLFHFGKSLSIEQLFPLSIFLISRKILRCYISRLKHLFSCLCSNTLSENEHYFHMLNSHAFFLSQMKQTLSLLHFPCFQMLEHFFHFFVYFLHLSFSRGVCTTVFTKPAVTRDLFDIQMSAGAC